MCGIAGVLEAHGERARAEDLRAMARVLDHRGPDGEGLHLDGRLGLSHRRLAILDLTAAGAQPMSNEDGTVWVAYNGQLYGFEAERERLRGRGHRFRSRTDTEILVHLYEEDGDGMLARIDGMFSFALWDARRRRLLLARDRFGIKPLYVARADGRLAFASEPGALRALSWVPREPDPIVLLQYLYQSTVPGTRPLVRGVEALAPGEWLVVEEGGTERRGRYWTLPSDIPPPTSFEAAAEELAERLRAAVRTHLVADVPVGTFLSGGLDSAAVTLAAREILDGPLHTFSVCFPGHRREDEGAAAREVSRELATEHHEVPLGPECLAELPAVLRAVDEPFAIASALALYHLARSARQRVKVVLTGDGADEILGGYPWRHEPEHGWGRARALGMIAVRSARATRGGGPGLTGHVWARLRRLFARPAERYAEVVSAFTPEELSTLVVPEMAEAARRAWAVHPLIVAYRDAPGEDEVNRRLRADLGTTLVDEMLTKVDRMTMAHGLEARVPFLDRALVEWAFAQPGRYKVRGGRGKRLLRRAVEPWLPAAARRPKHGFDPPLGAWIRGPWREAVRDRLAPDAVRRAGLLRPEAVQRLLDAHFAGRGDHGRKIFTLLTLETWREERRARGGPAAGWARAGVA